jgi:hypothetical protein
VTVIGHDDVTVIGHDDMINKKVELCYMALLYLTTTRLNEVIITGI